MFYPNIYIYIVIVIVIVLLFWWSPFIPSRNLDEVVIYNKFIPWNTKEIKKYRIKQKLYKKYK